MKVTDVQHKVLLDLLREGRLTGPRSSLERLAKKGLVEGSRRDGWSLTEKGLRWLASR